VPVAVEGKADKGNSVLYNLARHPETREDINIFVMHTDREVTRTTAQHRNLFDPNAKIYTGF